jgi:hypothetical protein
MSEFFDLSVVFDWIEEHAKTVELLKWIALLVAAWATGLFKLIKNKVRSPSIEIDSLTSSCLILNCSDNDGVMQRHKAIFFLKIGVNNSTEQPIVVRDFCLRYSPQKIFKRWTISFLPCTLPSRPQAKVGQSKKLLPTWFSGFDDGFKHLTLGNRIEEWAYEAGYILFITSSYGSMNPNVQNETVKVMVTCRLTSGQRLQSVAKVKVMTDSEKLEAIVPGIVKYSDQADTWNISRELSS